MSGMAALDAEQTKKLKDMNAKMETVDKTLNSIVLYGNKANFFREIVLQQRQNEKLSFQNKLISKKAQVLKQMLTL